MQYGFEITGAKSKKDEGQEQPIKAPMAPRGPSRTSPTTDQLRARRQIARTAGAGLDSIVALIAQLSSDALQELWAMASEEQAKTSDRAQQDALATIRGKIMEEFQSRGLEPATASVTAADDFMGGGMLHALWVKILEWIIGHNGYSDYADEYAFASLRERTAVKIPNVTEDQITKFLGLLEGIGYTIDRDQAHDILLAHGGFKEAMDTASIREDVYNDVRGYGGLPSEAGYGLSALVETTDVADAIKYPGYWVNEGNGWKDRAEAQSFVDKLRRTTTYGKPWAQKALDEKFAEPPASRPDPQGPFTHWKANRASEEITMDTSTHREAALLAEMASASLDRQREIAGELGQITAARSAAFDQDRELDLGGAVIRDTLTPVLTASLHTSATDWMDEGIDAPESGAVQRDMTAAASRWFMQTSAAVKGDVEEYQTQAQGMAHVLAGAHAPLHEVAADAFLRHAMFLNRTAGSQLENMQPDVDAQDQYWKERAEQEALDEEEGWTSHRDAETGTEIFQSRHVEAAQVVYHESYGNVSRAQLAAYRKFNVSPSDHDSLADRYGADNHEAITKAVKQFSSRNGMFSVFDMWDAGSDDYASSSDFLASARTAADADITPYPANEQAGYAETGLPPTVPVEGYDGEFDNFAPEVAPENTAAQTEEEGAPMPGFGEAVTGAVDAGMRSAMVQWFGPIHHEARRVMAGRSISEIAREIRQDWANVNFAAAPYLDAMSELNSISDSYGADDAKTIVLYFLNNASAYRGDKAKEIKAELRAMVKSGSVTAAEEAKTGATCSACGDSITRDPEGEANRTWHHTNGTSHDHEAKPSESKEASRKTAAIQFWSTPGHGFLGVPASEYPDAAAIARKSPYSWVNSGIAWLEEDGDAPQFLQAHPEITRESIIDAHHDNDPPGRFASKKVAAGGTQGIAIYPDKRVENVSLSDLKSYQDIVGGWIEPVTLSDGSTLYVNEEYMYQFGPDDFNSIATDVAGLGGRPEFMLRQPILGPVVLVGPIDAEGDDTDVTEVAKRWVQRVKREASLKTAGTDPEDQSGEAESGLPTPQTQTDTMWPWELPEGETVDGQGAADVASVPTPGQNVADYPQPKGAAKTANRSFPGCPPKVDGWIDSWDPGDAWGSAHGIAWGIAEALAAKGETADIDHNFGMGGSPTEDYIINDDSGEHFEAQGFLEALNNGSLTVDDLQETVRALDSYMDQLKAEGKDY